MSHDTPRYVNRPQAAGRRYRHMHYKTRPHGTPNPQIRSSAHNLPTVLRAWLCGRNHACPLTPFCTLSSPRKKHGIPGSELNDCCVVYWCETCALVQERREQVMSPLPSFCESAACVCDFLMLRACAAAVETEGHGAGGTNLCFRGVPQLPVRDRGRRVREQGRARAGESLDAPHAERSG